MNYRLDDYKYLYWKGTPIKQLYWKGNLKKEFDIPEPVVEFKGLCFTAVNANSTITQNIGKDGCTYSTSTDGINWEPYTLGTVITLTNAGDKVYWKGNGIENNGSNAIFEMTGKIAASGSVMSLIDGVGEITDMTGNDFSRMFLNCISLTTTPELPATKLTYACYFRTFAGCTSLTTVPELPATELDTLCYAYLFYNCTSLTTAPTLPATTLTKQCYFSMFQGCSKLITAPELQSTVLNEQCYCQMFYGCSSLTAAPELPSTTLTVGCYRGMFADCSKLTTAPDLPATTLTNQCYYQMFYGCSSLTTAPELPAATLTDLCYDSMFQGCSKLNYIKVGATSWNTSNTDYWVYGVSSTGTFVKPSATTIPAGVHGIPSGWTVEEPKVEIVLDESSNYFIEKYTDGDIEYHKFGTIPTNSLVNVVFDHSILVAEETIGNKFTVKNAQIGGYDFDGSVIAVLTPGAEMNLEYRRVGRDEMWVAV